MPFPLLAALPWVVTAGASAVGGAALFSWLDDEETVNNKQNDGVIVIENNNTMPVAKPGPDWVTIGAVSVGALLAAGMASGKVKVEL